MIPEGDEPLRGEGFVMRRQETYEEYRTRVYGEVIGKMLATGELVLTPPAPGPRNPRPHFRPWNKEEKR